MDTAAKGTVTAMSSLYSPEDTQTAAKRVQDAIAGRREEQERLRGFISDNANLINLVKRLPDRLHHNIMVPFGKAAFFPGRLVHTNEFMVLLGEGYYAEMTSKQTTEILKRREKSLESQVNSLNAVVQDLEAEASFFHATASEIAEGIMEIREEYVEEDSSVERESEPGPLQVSSGFSEADKEKVSVDDEEFARIMARLDVLEKEELEAETNQDSDEDDLTNAELEDVPHDISPNEMEHIRRPQSTKPLEPAKDKDMIPEQIISNQHRPDFTDELNCTGLTANSIPRDKPPLDGNTLVNKTKTSTKKTVPLAVVQNKVQESPSTSQVSEAPVKTSEPRFDSQKAFTGSIVEHAHNIERSSRKQSPSQTSSSQPSKPVSRFKMQRK